MANHMSNPMKKPYTQGKKISSQGQNELSTQQANEDPSRAVLRLWPGSTFCTPTNLTGIPAMPEKGVPVSSSLPVCDKLETTGTFLAKGSKSTLSICAREETQQPVGHASFFTSTHSHILSSLTTGMTTNPVSSTFQGHKQISVGSDSSSFNCWPNNENASEFSSKFPLNSSDDGPSVEQLVATDLNPQLAVNILMNYGLGEEDLDELLSYPEDQTTAENLPNTLHELRMKKIRRASASPKSYPGVSSQPTFVMDKVGRLDEIPQNSHRPSKVVDPGHSGKCFSEVEDKTDETICQTDKSDKNMLLIDGLKSSGNNNEVPQKRLTEVESNSEMSNIVATPSSNPTKPQTSPNQTSQKVITILSSSDKYKDMLEPTPEVLKSVPSEEPVHHAPSKTVPASSPGQSVNSGHSGVLQVISKDKSFVKSQTKTQQGSNMTEPGNQPIQQKMVQKPSALQIWEALQPAFPFNVKPVPKSFSFPSPSVASHSIQPPVFIGNDPGPSIIYSSQPVSDLSSTSMSRSRQPFLAKNPTFEGLPPLAMMHDFAAVPPRIFPHTCSLCMEECEQMKDWMVHQNTNLHLENCKRFRERYPEWDGELPRFPSALSRSAETPPPTSAHISQHHQKAGHESSCSRSHSPYSSGNRYRKSRSSSSSCSSGYRQHRSRDRRVKSCSSGSRSCSRSPRRRRSRERRAKPHSSISRSCSRSPRRCSSRERRPKPRSSISRSCSRSPRRCSSRERRPKPHSSISRSCSRSPRRCSSRERRPKPRSSSSRSRSHSPQRRSPRNRRDKSSSNSRSSSPHWQYRTEGQKGKYGKGPRSPHRAIYRIRSRSASPERQSSPRRTYRKLQHPETLKPRNYKRPSPTSFKQQLSSRRDEEKHLQPKKSDEDSASFKGSRKRRMSLEESSSNKKKLPGIKKLTDLLLENPVVQSLSGKPDIKDVVERMVPFVLAELANNTASSSLPSSSSSVPSQDKKRNASPSSYGGSNSSFSSKISKKHPTIQKSERSSYSKSKTVAYDKPSPPTIVKLKGVFDLLSHNDVVAAVKPFGKTKSVLLLKSKQEATVCFEKEKNAEKLRSVKSIDVKGVTLTVVPKRGSVPKSVSPASTEDQIKQTKEKSTVSSEPCSAEKLVLLQGTSPVYLPAEPKPTTSFKKKKKVLATKGKDEVAVKRAVKDGKEEDGCSGVKLKNPAKVKKNLIVTKAKRKALKSHTTVQTATVMKKRRVKTANSAEAEKSMKVELSRSQSLISETAEETAVPSEPTSSINQPDGSRTPITDNITEPLLVRQVSIPDSSAENPTVDPKTSGSSASAALEPPLIVIEVHTKTNPTDAIAHGAETKPTMKTTEQAPATVATFTPETFLTIGDKIEWYLSPHKFNCVTAQSILSSGVFTFDSTLLLITNLPEKALFTEADLVNLLSRFGLENEHDNIYIFPQLHMAFALMPNEHSVRSILKASVNNHLFFRQNKLFLHVVKNDILMTPLWFYKALMSLTPLGGKTNGQNLVYIRNISPSEVQDLREVLKKIGSVTNFLPLLNKVFIEFKSMHDADRLGVWYSFLKRGFTHIVHRLKTPQSNRRTKCPELPMNALPDKKLIIPGADVPNAKYGIPHGTTPPFWITMTTIPYVFSTACPWFNVPDFLTIQGKQDRVTNHHPGSGYCTVMLTGLPEGNYTHEDVARLVWRYFPKKNLQTLYYNILVLPLQRRAFVYFCSQEACCRFVRFHIKRPLVLCNVPLQVHFVLQDLRHEPREEIMYRVLMKWSNSYVPELNFLENRLLCVELSEVNMDLIWRVIKEVATMSCFLNFLPLANRICIEMVESSGVKKVLDEIDQRGDLLTHKTWAKVRHVESLNGLKQRLRDTSEITLNLERDNGAKPKTGAQPRLSDEAKADSEKPATSDTSMVSQSEAVLQKSPAKVSASQKRPERGAAEPSKVSTFGNEPEERTPEASRVSKSETKSDKQSAIPSNVPKSIGSFTLKFENKSGEVEAEMLNTSQPEIMSKNQPAKPSNVPKSDNKPQMRAKETTKASLPDKPAMKPSNVCKSVNKPEERAAEPPTISKSENRPEEGVTETLKAPIPDKPAPKPSNVCKSQDKQEGPLRASKPEVLPNSQSAKPSNIPKPQNKPAVRVVEMTTASEFEVNPYKPATKPSNVSKSENQPEVSAAEPTKAFKPQIKPDEQAKVSKSESKSEGIAIEPSCGSTSKNKQDGPSNVSKSEIILNKPAMKPSNVSKSQNRQEGPLRASKSEVLPNSQPAKPSNVPKSDNKPQVRAKETTKASLPDKPATKPSIVCKSVNKPEERAAEPPTISKSENRPEEGVTETLKAPIPDKPAPKPSNVCKSQDKQEGPLRASKPEVLPNSQSAKPSNIPKPQNKPAVRVVEMTTASEFEVNPYKPATKPSNVSKSENQPEVSAAEPTKAFKPQIKPDEQAKVSKSESKSEGIAIEPSCGSTSKNKQDGPSNVSKSEIILNKPAMKPSNVSKSQNRQEGPLRASKSEVLPNSQSAKPSNVPKSDNKPQVRAKETTKASLPDKPATKPSIVCKSVNKPEERAAEPPTISKSENRPEEGVTETLKAPIPDKPAPKPSNVCKSQDKQEGPLRASKPEVLPNSQSAKPSNIPKPQNKPAVRVVEMTKASEFEVNPYKPATKPSNVSKSENQPEVSTDESTKAFKPQIKPDEQAKVSKSESKTEGIAIEPSCGSTSKNKQDGPSNVSKSEIILNKPTTKPSNVSKSENKPEVSTAEPTKAFKPQIKPDEQAKVSKSESKSEGIAIEPSCGSTSKNKQDGPSNVSKSEIILNKPATKPLNVSKSEIILNKPSMKPSNVSKSENQPEVSTDESTKAFKPQIKPDEQAKVSKSESKTEGIAIEPSCGSTSKNKQDGPSNVSKSEIILNKPTTKPSNVSKSENKPEVSTAEPTKAFKPQIKPDEQAKVSKSESKSEGIAIEPSCGSTSKNKQDGPSNVSKSEIILNKPATKPLNVSKSEIILNKPSMKPSNVSKSENKPEVSTDESTKAFKPQIKPDEQAKVSKSESKTEGIAIEPSCGSTSKNKQDGPSNVSKSEIILNKPTTKPSNVSKSENKPEVSTAEPTKAFKPQIKPDEQAKVSKSESKSEGIAIEPSCGSTSKNKQDGPSNVSKSEIILNKPATKPLNVSKSEIILNKPSMKPSNVSKSENKPEVSTAEPTKAFKPQIKPDEQAKVSKPESKTEGIAIEPSCGSTSKNKQDGPSNVSKSESILNEPATKPSNVSKSEIILNKPAMKPSNISKSEIILNKPAMKPSNISKSEIILNKPAMKPSNISKSEIILNKPATEPLNVSKSEIILNKPATNPSNVSISETKPKEKTGKPSILSSFENKPGKEAAEAPRDAKPEVILDNPSTKPPEVSLSAVRPKESAPETPKASKWDQPYPKHLNVCKSVNDPEKRVPGPPTISTSDNKSEERLTETPKAPVPDKPATKPSNISKYMIKPEVRAAESTKLSKPQIRPNEQSVQPLKASKSESKTEGMAVEHLFGSKCENKQEGPSKSSETEAIFNKAAAKLPDVPSSMVKPEDSAPETPKASRWDQPVPKHLNVCKSVNKPEERAPGPPTESEERITETPKPVSDKPATKPSNVSKSMIKPEVGAAELTKVSKPEIKSSEHSVEPLKASKSESRPEGTAMEPLCGSKPENKQEGPPKVSMPEIIFNKPAAKPSDVSKSGISVGEKATEPSTVYKPEAKPKETAGEPLTASSFEDKPGKGAAEVPRVSKPEFMPDKPSTAPSDVSTSTVKPEAKQKAGEPRVASSFENKPEKGAAEVPRLTKPEVMPDKPSTAPSHASKSEIRLKEKAVEPPSVCKPEAITGGKAPVPQETLLSSKAETTGVTPPGQLFTETRAAAGPVAIPKTQSDSASNAASNASASSPVSPAAPAAVRKQPAAASTPSVTELTVGERIGSLLVPQKISCINRKAIQSLNVTPRLCLITKLPTHRYTEDDVVQLLQKFGFEYEDKNIYVIPQARMAFALMPSFESAKGLFMVPRHNLNIGGFQLDVDIVSSGILMTPFEFYKSLMEKMDHKVADDGESTIYIQNIDSDEAGALRETLKRIKCVKNYLPLLNKVFVEFESVRDADRIGVWYSLRKHCPPHIFRMKMPRSTSIAPAPRLAANALPDSEDLVSGVIAPTTNFGVPPGSLPPFSVTLLTYPFVFPTLSPWFIIPPFLSVERQKGVWVSVSKFNRLSTVMLTGLPEGNYRHEDVAKLVWQHFPNKNLQTLFYNILVLPLQRRAFVYFGNHSACTSFVHNSLKNPLSIKGNKLSIHLVPQRMGPRECEEAMYTTMMKWSNAHVPKLGSLSVRLLCLELYETSVQLIIALMKKVTDIAPIVSFLPLANRLCIEMSEPSGVTTVLEKIAGSRADWCRVRRAESCESLRQRLQDCSGITVDLDQDTEGVDVLKSGPLLHPARLPEKTPQLAPQGPAPRHLHVPAPKEQNASATQTPQTSSQKTAVMGGNEKTEQTAVKTLSAPSTSGLEKQPDAPGKGQSEVVLQDTIGASGRRNETAPGIKEPAEPVKAEPEEVKVQSKEVKETKSVELVKREAPENVEVKGSAAVCEGLTPTTPPEPPTGPPQRPLTTLKPQQTSVKASSEVQKPVEPNPESTTQKLETTTAASREQQQKTGNSDLVEAGINPTSKAVKVSAVAPEKTSSAQTESKQQSAAAGSQKQMNPTTSSAPNLHLTPGEKLKEYQALDKLRCTSLKYPTIFSEHVSSIHISLAITNLSKFNNGCYTEADIIKLLQKYEIQCEENKLFVLPHIHMAFVLFPDVSKVQTLFKVSEQVKAKSVVLKGSELSVFAFSLPNKSFLSFYEFLKRLATFKKRKGPRDKTSIVYVWSISQSEAAHLRQALRKIGGLMNYQPMLNKVLVEFLTSLDADRFGIWCSFLKPCFSYSVFRMGVPCPNTPNVLPSLSVLALSDRDVTVAGASSPSSPMGIPVGTGTTFWVTMTTNPYVYPTGLPLFNIPAFRTVTPRSQIKHLEPVRLYRLKVIMLTGLPPNIYTQEDFAKLVWKHFPEENLDPLDNNVMFLPLQRRAFVYFSGWEACFSFLESYIRNPFYKRNYKLCVHYVLDNIFLNTNEETVYRVLMKWSNSYVSDVKSLGERLLCVEVSGRGIPFVCTVMKRVASIATFVSFLPLANRIYIEMAESSGVTKVVGTLSASKSSEQCETWKQVGRVESLKSRKLRLQDSKRTAVNLELSNVGVHSESTADKEAPKTGWDHAELGSLVLDPAAATGLSSTAMEEERREAEVPVCSITDLGTAEEKKEESVTNSSPSPTSLAQPQADLPPIDSSSFRALKEVIHLYKLHHSKQVQEATKDVRSSEVCDKTDLNFENFITIDEINEDEVDKDVSPSSKPTSRDSEEASKPTSSSPSSTDASPSSTELQKHPLEPNKSQTNPSSSANNTSPFVPSSKSVEPSVSPGLKAQPIRAKTPKRASQALPTGRVTRSSAAAVKTSVETLRSHQKEGEPPGGAMAEASAESSTETSDIRPPSPRDKLETVLKDVKTRKEKDEGKSTEVTEKSEEDDLVMSSLDEQMNKVSNEETQKPRSEGDQVSQNECLHVSEVNKDQICSEIKNAKHESATAQQEEGSPPKPDQAMEENQNVPVNQDESQTEDGEKVKDFQEESIPKMSARRSSRGTKGLKTSPDKVTIVTRSTRGRRTMTAEESEDGEKNGKEKETPTRPGRTLGRNEQQLNNEDTPKVKDITPTNKTNTDGDTDGPKTSLEVSGESEEETKQAASPRKRGRPRKTTTVASPVLNKKIAELVEPEAKRSRSRSPRVSADFKLPPFSPDKPLGTEFVSRKWGYFCNLCSVSYMSEGATGDQHCRSQTHAENLQRYQQALERKSRISTRKTF
ncbi:uncharacterized protein [Nothobranchius furzeri]